MRISTSGWPIWASCVLVAVAGVVPVRAADWPTYRHDNYRSGKTPEQLPATKLVQTWRWQSPSPPQPAWPAHTRWDAFANLKGLKSMRNYDPVFHPIVVGQSLYFGSSVDDSVYSLDTRTGKVQWIFTTDGPVRIAPTYSDGKLYFGSDDGAAYCVEANTGKLVWKFQPPAADKKILHNGRFISLHPVRTGVLVDNGSAYFGAGMLPWHATFLCAVSAETGKVEAKNHYVQKLEQATIEGPLLCTTTHLVTPQGRVPPLLFDRGTGKKVGQLSNGGGCFVLITPDDQVLHGPGNKTGWITGSNVKTGAKLATYKDATAMVVHGNLSYLLTENSLLALDRAGKKTLWTKPSRYPHDLILADETIFTGGQDEVRAFDTKSGQQLCSLEVFGRAYGLAAADGALFVSTDEGEITCFRPGKTDVPQKQKIEKKQYIDRLLKPAEVALGPYLHFTGPDSAVLQYETAEPCTTRVNLLQDKAIVQEVRHEKKTTRHKVTLKGLRRNTEYQYQIHFQNSGEEKHTQLFDCDTTCNYTLTALDAKKSPFPNDAQSNLFAQAAGKVLKRTGQTSGICLMLGMDNGQLAWELSRQSNLRIVGVDTDAQRVAELRARFLKAGCYGSRISVYHVPSYDALPFNEQFANLVVPGSTGPVNIQQTALRHLHPYGGTAYTTHPLTKAKDEKPWIYDLAPPEGAGVWSHLYGLPDNAAYAGEKLNGAKGVEDLEEQWLGEPGPRFNPDRNGRKPAPLAIGGKLFVQGLHRLMALDAYNGSILWSLEGPPLARFNMPRDCGNWCADEQNLFVAVKGHCWRIDSATGAIKDFWPVLPGPRKDWQYEWGYIARSKDCLVGSAVKAGSSHTNFWGGATSGWYDAKGGEVTHQIGSDNLFALDSKSGKKRWLYTGGVLLNPTITIGAGHVYFVECRHPKVMEANTRRLGMPELWQQQFLIALDLGTGNKLWEKPLKVEPGTVVFYLAHAEDKLVLVSSQKQYHVYAFNAKDGSPLWNVQFPWQNGDHGGHMSHPAIVGGKIYVRPRVLELTTGKLLPQIMPRGGCGSYACSTSALFFRAGNVNVLDLDKAKVSSWTRLRPDCWISTIPACGLLLSPEGGGGCSCGSWMETSIVFRPRMQEAKFNK